MVSLAITILWFLIGLIVLLGVVYLGLKVVKTFIPTLDPRVEQAVWLIALILILIAALSMLAGGGIHFSALR